MPACADCPRFTSTSIPPAPLRPRFVIRAGNFVPTLVARSSNSMTSRQLVQSKSVRARTDIRKKHGPVSSRTSHPFFNYDDPQYVSENEHIQAGLSRSTLIWALSTADASNWHPLTWLSHALDCELFGLEPRGHHISSLVIHVMNVLLLFLLLLRLTGYIGRSAFVAALFALHPLNVESVAWIAERKNVLSTLFFLLTLIA